MNENPYAAPQAEPSAPLAINPRSRRTSPYGPYREIGWLHWTVVGLLMAGIAVAAIQIVIINRLNDAMRSFDAELADLEQIESLEQTSQYISMASGSVMILTIIFWCIWKNKSCKNAWLFYSHSGARRISTNKPQTPGWAVGFYFIPIVHLWKPFQAMSFIRDQVSSHVKTGLLLGLWWTAWLVWIIYSRVRNKFDDGYETIEGAIAHNEKIVVGAVIMIVTAPLAAAVIHLLSIGQKRAAKKMKRETSQVPVDPNEKNGWKHALPPV